MAASIFIYICRNCGSRCACATWSSDRNHAGQLCGNAFDCTHTHTIGRLHNDGVQAESGRVGQSPQPRCYDGCTIYTVAPKHRRLRIQYATGANRFDAVAPERCASVFNSPWPCLDDASTTHRTALQEHPITENMPTMAAGRMASAGLASHKKKTEHKRHTNSTSAANTASFLRIGLNGVVSALHTHTHTYMRVRAPRPTRTHTHTQQTHTAVTRNSTLRVEASVCAKMILGYGDQIAWLGL